VQHRPDATDLLNGLMRYVNNSLHIKFLSTAATLK